MALVPPIATAACSVQLWAFLKETSLYYGVKTFTNTNT